MSTPAQDEALSGHDRTELDTSDYSLTIEEASELFAEAGVPRNPRSIRRFCQRKELDCISIETPTSSRYLISRTSAEKLILEKQQALKFSEAHRSPAISGHDRTEPAASGQDRTEPDVTTVEQRDGHEATKLIKTLEDENMNLWIDNRAKEQVIVMLRDERREFQRQFQEVSYRLGAAEARVAQLEAPKRGEAAESQPGATTSVTEDHATEPRAQPFWPVAE